MGTLALTGGKAICEKPLENPLWPPISEKTADKLKEVYLSRKWSFNEKNEQEFAKEFAAYCGAKHGIVMANGTVTLLCALEAVGVKQGDEVIVPALTWIATAMAVRYLGAIPVFVDIEPTTLCLDPKKVKSAITDKTTAIIPVHLYGAMADLEKLQKIATDNKLAMIEDCAHMHGGVWNGKGAGAWGDVGSFSFQQSKTVASGEGGICITSNDELAEKIYKIKHIGYGDGTKQGQAEGPPGNLICHNFRATEFQAVILRDQLKDLPTLMETYNKNAKKLEELIAQIDGLKTQARGRLADVQGYYGFMVIYNESPLAEIEPATIIAACAKEGLSGIMPTYGPVYTHTLFNLPENEYRVENGSCPVAEILGHKQTFGFIHPKLSASAENLEKTAEILAKVVENAEELKQFAKAKK